LISRLKIGGGGGGKRREGEKQEGESSGSSQRKREVDNGPELSAFPSRGNRKGECPEQGPRSYFGKGGRGRKKKAKVRFIPVSPSGGERRKKKARKRRKRTGWRCGCRRPISEGKKKRVGKRERPHPKKNPEEGEKKKKSRFNKTKTLSNLTWCNTCHGHGRKEEKMGEKKERRRGGFPRDHSRNLKRRRGERGGGEAVLGISLSNQKKKKREKWGRKKGKKKRIPRNISYIHPVPTSKILFREKKLPGGKKGERKILR